MVCCCWFCGTWLMFSCGISCFAIIGKKHSFFNTLFDLLMHCFMWFLILFGVLFGKLFDISDHRGPVIWYVLIRLISSSWDHGVLSTLGERYRFQRSLHCLAVLPGMQHWISFQACVPFVSTSIRSLSSSSWVNNVLGFLVVIFLTSGSSIFELECSLSLIDIKTFVFHSITKQSLEIICSFWGKL